MADIILYDRTGAAVTYEGVETLTTDTPVEGERTTFTHGVLMEGAEIELSMAAGDQEFSVPDGYLIKKVIVKKPETLVPENIPKGIEIAGVLGNALVTKFDATDENLKYFFYQIDEENQKIVLSGILYERIYEETGSYDVNIPDKLGNYDVVIMSAY